MRSFANHRWILAVTVVAAVLAVFFCRPRTAWAAAGNGKPQGPQRPQCTKGENASANAKASEECASCSQVITESRATSAAVNYVYQGSSQATLELVGGGGYLSGTTASDAGSLSMPGTRDGMLDPHWGGITMTVPVGICGTCIGFGREFANIVATDRSDAGGGSHGGGGGPGAGGPGGPGTPPGDGGPPPDG